MDPEEKGDAIKTNKGSELPSSAIENKFMVEIRIVKEEPKKGKSSVRKYGLLGACLILAFIGILWYASIQYEEANESHITGGYVVTRDLTDIPDPISFQIDEYNNIRSGVMGRDNGAIVVMSMLDVQRGSPDSYKLELIAVKGKKSITMPISEIILPGTAVIAKYSDPDLELGHTLEVELKVKKINSTSGKEDTYTYNILAFRESTGTVYYTDKKAAAKQEPGFEAMLAFSAIMLIAVVTRRKKE